MRLSSSLVLASFMVVTAACGPKPPPVTPEVGHTEPAESEEDALRRELLASLRELVANVVSNESSRPLNPDIVPFLTKAYELVGERQDELLRKADLAIKLAEGASLAEAATLLEISEHTARTSSKRIYSKTGTSRQAELVQVILASVARVGCRLR